VVLRARAALGFAAREQEIGEAAAVAGRDHEAHRPLTVRGVEQAG
jgi:hypothetical protein